MEEDSVTVLIIERYDRSVKQVCSTADTVSICKGLRPPRIVKVNSIKLMCIKKCVVDKERLTDVARSSVSKVIPSRIAFCSLSNSTARWISPRETRAKCIGCSC